MNTQFFMTLACVVAARASSLAQVTASLGQNQPALDQITVNLGQTKLALDQSTVNVAQNKPALEQDTATQLLVQPPAPFPSEISVPTVPPAPSPSSPPPSTTPGANPDQLYNTPRQRSEDLAAAEPEVVEQSLRAEGFPDTIGAPATAPPPAAVQMDGMPYEFEWSVRDATSGSMYSHQEDSDGTVAQGEYRVLLPDGRLQIVTFVDRGQGYEARVVYQDYDGF